MTDELLDGTAQLLLFDALTMKPIDVLFFNQNNSKSFTCGKKGSTQVSFDIQVPFGIQAVVYRITAQSGNFSDGEENALPVLTNRMLVTETLPLPIRGGKSKDFIFEKLKNNKSKTLTNHSLTLEITAILFGTPFKPCLISWNILTNVPNRPLVACMPMR